MLKINLDELEKQEFGMTKAEAINKGICINCKNPVSFYSGAGRKEYFISGYCEYCFDEEFKDEND